MAQFQLYTRAGCGLCEEMFEALIELGLVQSDIEWVDIERRPELSVLYGSKIPVLEHKGTELAAGRLNEQSQALIRQIL